MAARSRRRSILTFVIACFVLKSTPEGFGRLLATNRRNVRTLKERTTGRWVRWWSGLRGGIYDEKRSSVLDLPPELSARIAQLEDQEETESVESEEMDSDDEGPQQCATALSSEEREDVGTVKDDICGESCDTNAEAEWDRRSKLRDDTLSRAYHKAPVHSIRIGPSLPDPPKTSSPGNSPGMPGGLGGSPVDKGGAPPGCYCLERVEKTPSLVVSGDQNDRAILWETRFGRVVRVLRGHTDTVMACGFTAGYKYIVTASLDGTVRIWSLPSPEEVAKLINRFEEEAENLTSLHSDGNLNALSERLLKIEREGYADQIDEDPEDEPEGEPMEIEQSEHAAGISSLPEVSKKSPGDSDSRGCRENLSKWECDKVKEGNVVHVLEGMGEITWMDIHPKGQVIACGDSNGLTWIWNVEKGNLINCLTPGNDGASLTGSWTPDGRQIAVGYNYSKTVIWSPRTGNLISRYHHETQKEGYHRKGVIAMSWHPKKSLLLTGGLDGRVFLINTHTMVVVQHLPRHKDSVEMVAFCPNDRWMMSASTDGNVHVYDSMLHRVRVTLKHPLAVTAAKIRVSMPDPNPDPNLNLNHPGSHPQGTHARVICVTGCADGYIRVWDALQGILLHKLHGFGYMIYCLDISMDSSLVVGGGDDAFSAAFDAGARSLQEDHGQRIGDESHPSEHPRS